MIMMQQAISFNYQTIKNPIEWNFENQPTFMVFTDNKGAFYSYDATGERVRKVVLTNTFFAKERIYLGNFEIYREKQNGDVTKERTSLHIADDSGRICIIEIVTKNTDRNAPNYEQAGKKTYRYQLSNHLGSVGMEVNHTGDIISFEEYHPYGTTAFSWKNTEISQKQYRYTGQERDEESGLSYHSARFYMPWLGRWLSADPGGFIDGLNLYGYTNNRPLNLLDLGGYMGTQPEEYTIQSGDTFWDLSQRSKSLFGRDISVNQLILYNKEIDPRKLQIGSRINTTYPEREFSWNSGLSDNTFENLDPKSLNSPVLGYSVTGIGNYYSNFSEDSKSLVRIRGVLKLIAGAIEIVAGGALVVTPEPVTTVGGSLLAAHGTDTFYSGWQELWYGEEYETLTSRNLQDIGFSKEKAELTDAVIPIIITAGTSLVLKAPTISSTIINLSDDVLKNTADDFIRLFNPQYEADFVKTIFRGTTGTESGSAILFLTDEAAVAATYVKNGGSVVQYEISQSAIYSLELTGELTYNTGIHLGGNVSKEYVFHGQELVKALNSIAKPY